MTIKEKIFDFAECLIDGSGGEIYMVFNEKAESNKTDKEAAHFLKLDGKRLGRDLELYNFMVKIMGLEGVLVRLLEEILIPIKKLELSYSKGSSYLKDWGCEVFKPELKEEWTNLF